MSKQTYNPNKTVNVTRDKVWTRYVDTGETSWIYYSTNSKLAKLQQEGINSKVKRFHDDEIHLNEAQTQLYKVYVYGLFTLSKEQLQNMPRIQLTQMSVTHKRAQRLLNRWKQNSVSQQMDKLLLGMFPKSRIFKYWAEQSDYHSDKDINRFTFKDLGISKRMIIQKLIDWKILPTNFYELT